MTVFILESNRFTGSIPSSIGAWTDVRAVSFADNMLSGMVPHTVAAWTALDAGFFYSNNLNGAMPTFGGDFCPKKGNGSNLLADCKNNTGQAKISCACCKFC
jgi:hypothetical protein